MKILNFKINEVSIGLMLIMVIIFLGCAPKLQPPSPQIETVQPSDKGLNHEILNLKQQNDELNEKLKNQFLENARLNEELQQLKIELSQYTKQIKELKIQAAKYATYIQGSKKKKPTISSTPQYSPTPTNPVTNTTIISPPKPVYKPTNQIIVNGWAIDKNLSPAATYDKAVYNCDCKQMTLPPKTILFQASDNADIQLNNEGEWSESKNEKEAVVVKYGHKTNVVYKTQYKLSYRCARRVK